jgi:hypothetical protein
MTAKNRIEEIKRQGYDINFNDVFNKSLEIYKKIAINAGIVFILFSIMIVAIAMGTMGAFFGFTSIAHTMTSFNMESMSALNVIIYVVFLAIISALASPFTAGIIKMAHAAAHNQEFSINTAFEYYKAPYFKELFVATLLITLIGGAVNGIIESMGVTVVGALLTYLISFFTFLTIPLIILGDLKAMEAIQGSIIIVSKKPLVLFALLLVAVIMACIGIFAFCIGLFFTIPFVYATYYGIYDAVIGTGFRSELDEIGSHTE